VSPRTATIGLRVALVAVLGLLIDVLAGWACTQLTHSTHSLSVTICYLTAIPLLGVAMVGGWLGAHAPSVAR